MVLTRRELEHRLGDLESAPEEIRDWVAAVLDDDEEDGETTDAHGLNDG